MPASNNDLTLGGNGNDGILRIENKGGKPSITLEAIKQEITCGSENQKSTVSPSSVATNTLMAQGPGLVFISGGGCFLAGGYSLRQGRDAKQYWRGSHGARQTR